MFTKYIEPLHICYLKDRALAIRTEAISHLRKFAKTYGMSWVNSYILKLVEIETNSFQNSTNIIDRIINVLDSFFYCK